MLLTIPISECPPTWAHPSGRRPADRVRSRWRCLPSPVFGRRRPGPQRQAPWKALICWGCSLLGAGLGPEPLQARGPVPPSETRNWNGPRGLSSGGYRHYMSSLRLSSEQLPSSGKPLEASPPAPGSSMSPWLQTAAGGSRACVHSVICLLRQPLNLKDWDRVSSTPASQSLAQYLAPPAFTKPLLSMWVNEQVNGELAQDTGNCAGLPGEGAPHGRVRRRLTVSQGGMGSLLDGQGNRIGREALCLQWAPQETRPSVLTVS